MTTIKVTTANICGNPLRPKWAVRRRMRRALTIGGVTFGQEVPRSNHWHTDNYSAMWHRVAAALDKSTAGGVHEVPVSTPKGWETEEHVILVHGGKKRVSPARYITVVKVPALHVAFANCHPVSKPRRGVPFSAWRIARWNEYHARLKAEVAELHAGGYTVVFGGDMNKRSVAVVHPGQRLLVQSGLDHLWAVPAEGKAISQVVTTKVPRTVLMDHPILTATLRIT